MNQVITLAQARKLWELGVEKEAYFMWRSHNGKAELWRYNKTAYITPVMDVRFYLAYNAEELIAMMQGDLYMHRCDEEYFCCGDEYQSDENSDIYKHKAETLTQALCNKLIHDIENGIITVEEINT